MPPVTPHAPPSRPFTKRLADCRELYARELAAALEASVARIDAELCAHRKEAAELEASLQWLEAQYQFQTLTHDLPARFAHAFDTAWRRRTESPAAPDGGTGDDGCLLPAFRLFAPASVEISAETQALSAPLETHCAAALRRLRPHVALLLGCGELDAHTDPFGPATLCEALLNAASLPGDTPENRARIVHTLAADLAAALPGLLAQAEVLLAVPGASAPARSPGQCDPVLPGALAAARLGASALHYGGRRFALEHSPHTPTNQTRALLDAGLGKLVTEADRTILDIIATLFGHLFDNAALPPAMKLLIARLQLPILQLALNDHDFFTRHTHPARRLLNLLVLASVTWDGELTPESSLCREAGALIERIERERDLSPAVFAACHGALENWLNEQERHVDARTAALTAQLEERERRQLARRNADQELAPLVTDASLPDSLRAFLDTTWPDILTRAWLDGGPGGPAWRHARALLQDLVWSVRPKRSAKERQRLTRLLGPLLHGLRAILPPGNAQTAMRDAFLGELARLHAAAVRGGMTASPAPQTPGSTPERQPAYRGNTAPEPENDTHLELALLARGDWLELRGTDSTVRRVRLAWISPARTLYLFANRQGLRAVALTSGELARRFAAGEATRVDHDAVFDRLVDDALERYENRS